MNLAAGYGNVSDFEIIFLTVSVFGFVFAALNLLGIHGDWKYLKTRKLRDGTWYLTKAALVTETGRLYLQAVFIYIAVLSMRAPDPPPEVITSDRILNAIARWSFLVGAATVCAKTIYTYHVRHRLVEDGELLDSLNHKDGENEN